MEERLRCGLEYNLNGVYLLIFPSVLAAAALNLSGRISILAASWPNRCWCPAHPPVLPESALSGSLPLSSVPTHSSLNLTLMGCREVQALCLTKRDHTTSLWSRFDIEFENAVLQNVVQSYITDNKSLQKYHERPLAAIIISYFCRFLASEFKVKGKHTDAGNKLKNMNIIPITLIGL